MTRLVAPLVLLFALLATACGGVAAEHGAQRSLQRLATHVSVRVAVRSAPAVEAGLIRTAAKEVGATHVTAIRLDRPPPGVRRLAAYGGSRWLYENVQLTDPQADGMQVDQDWQAARVAGRVRDDARSAGLPTPFGYTVTGVLPSGQQLEPFSIVFGELEEGPGPGAPSAARLVRAVASLGLHHLQAVLSGADNALIIRARTDEVPQTFLEHWPDVLQGLVRGNAQRPWLVEIDDSQGQPIKAFAFSPSTNGADGWTRPDLREYEVQLTGGF
jgi:hypothetical protein